MADEKWTYYTGEPSTVQQDTNSPKQGVSRVLSGFASTIKRTFEKPAASPYIGEAQKKRRWERNPLQIAYNARVWGLSDNWKETATAHRMDPDMMLAPEWAPDSPQPFTELLDRSILGLFAVFVFDDPNLPSEGAPSLEFQELIFEYCRKGNDEGLIPLIRRYPSLPLYEWEGYNNHGMRRISPLIQAVMHGQLGCVDALVECGVDIDRQFEHGLTALMIAARHGRLGCLKRLLHYRADPDLTIVQTVNLPYGQGVDTGVGLESMAKFALETVVEIGALALSLAGKDTLNRNTTQSDPELKKGDREVKGDHTMKGTTALVMAVQMNQIECAKLLIDAGADHSLLDSSGKRAVDYAWTDDTAERIHILAENQPPRGPLLVRSGQTRRNGVDTTFLLSHYAKIYCDGFHPPMHGCKHWIIKGNWRGKDVAIKVFGTESIFQREKGLLESLKSSFVVQLLTTSHHLGKFTIGMELCHSSFADVPAPVRSDLALSLISQSAECLSFIHQRGLVHGDLCPHHLLLASDDVAVNRVVLCSLWHMCRVGEMQPVQQDNPYVSPERRMAGKKCQANPSSDMWSLGAIWFHLLTGSYDVDAERMESIKPEALRSLVCQLLDFDAENRPTAMETADTVSSLSVVGTSAMMSEMMSTLESVKRDTAVTRAGVADLVTRDE